MNIFVKFMKRTNLHSSIDLQFWASQDQCVYAVPYEHSAFQPYQGCSSEIKYFLAQLKNQR